MKLYSYLQQYLKHHFNTLRFQKMKSEDRTFKKEQFFVQEKLLGVWKKWVTTLSVCIAISAGIAEGTGYSLRDLFSEDVSDTFSITVMVHGDQGRGHLILRNQGTVLLDVGDIRLEAPINYQGVAIFKDVPLQYKQQKASLFVDHPTSFQPISKQKLYDLQEGQSIYFGVETTYPKNSTIHVVDF